MRLKMHIPHPHVRASHLDVCWEEWCGVGASDWMSNVGVGSPHGKVKWKDFPADCCVHRRVVECRWRMSGPFMLQLSCWCTAAFEDNVFFIWENLTQDEPISTLMLLFWRLGRFLCVVYRCNDTKYVGGPPAGVFSLVLLFIVMQDQGQVFSLGYEMRFYSVLTYMIKQMKSRLRVTHWINDSLIWEQSK